MLRNGVITRCARATCTLEPAERSILPDQLTVELTVEARRTPSGGLPHHTRSSAQPRVNHGRRKTKEDEGRSTPTAFPTLAADACTSRRRGLSAIHRRDGPKAQKFGTAGSGGTSPPLACRVGNPNSPGRYELHRASENLTYRIELPGKSRARFRPSPPSPRTPSTAVQSTPLFQDLIGLSGHALGCERACLSSNHYSQLAPGSGLGTRAKNTRL